MPAYIVSVCEFTSRTPALKEYAQKSADLAHRHGGKYIVRGGKVETLEGKWSPTRLVILEFLSVDQAKAWLNSPEYSPIRKIRHETATSEMIIVEGVPG